MRTSSVLLLATSLALTGCGGAVIGSASACLATDADVSLDYQSGYLYQVAGDVVAQDASTTMPSGDGVTNVGWCFDDISRVVQIRDGDGKNWWLGYTIGDAAGTDRTPVAPVETGETVQLKFRAVMSFGYAAGFVLSGDQGLAMALEQGTWGPALEPDDVPGLQVSVGDRVATELEDCGTRFHQQLRFTGETVVDLAPGEEAALSIGGKEFTAHTIASYEWDDDVHCTDLAGNTSWVVWR